MLNDYVKGHSHYILHPGVATCCYSIGIQQLTLLLVISSLTKELFECSFPGGNSHSTNSLNYSKPETSEMNELENGRTVAYNGSYAQYTTVRPTVNEDARLPSKQGIVYEPLSFN